MKITKIDIAVAILFLSMCRFIEFDKEVLKGMATGAVAAWYVTRRFVK